MKKSLLLLALFSFIQIPSIFAMEEAVLNQAELDHQLFENIDQPEVVVGLIHREANVNAKKQTTTLYTNVAGSCYLDSLLLFWLLKRGF